jgi:ribonuclease PH
MNGAGEFIELQGTGEEATFTETQLAGLLHTRQGGIRDLIANQAAAISNRRANGLPHAARRVISSPEFSCCGRKILEPTWVRT